MCCLVFVVFCVFFFCGCVHCLLLVVCNCFALIVVVCCLLLWGVVCCGLWSSFVFVVRW